MIRTVLLVTMMAGCSGPMAVGAGVGVTLAGVGALPLVIDGGSETTEGLRAAGFAVIGGAIVLGSLIGYAVGQASASAGASASSGQ